MGPVAWPTSRVAGSERTHRFEYPAAMDARGFARCGLGHDVWFLLRRHVAPEATRLRPWDHANRSEPAGHHAAFGPVVVLVRPYPIIMSLRRLMSDMRQECCRTSRPIRRHQL